MVADVAMLIDRSGSITDQPPYYQNWISMLAFLRDFVSSMYIAPDAVRIACVTFANKATVRFDLDDTENVMEVLSRLKGIEDPVCNSFIKYITSNTQKYDLL